MPVAWILETLSKIFVLLLCVCLVCVCVVCACHALGHPGTPRFSAPRPPGLVVWGK